MIIQPSETQAKYHGGIFYNLYLHMPESNDWAFR